MYTKSSPPVPPSKSERPKLEQKTITVLHFVVFLPFISRFGRCSWKCWFFYMAFSTRFSRRVQHILKKICQPQPSLDSFQTWWKYDQGNQVFAARCTMFMIFLTLSSMSWEICRHIGPLQKAQRTMSIFKIDLCKSTQLRCKTSASINMKFQLHKGHEASWWFQPIWKILVKSDHFRKFSPWKFKTFELPPPRSRSNEVKKHLIPRMARSGPRIHSSRNDTLLPTPATPAIAKLG